MPEISVTLSPAKLTRVKCRFKPPSRPVLQIYPLPHWSPKSKRLLLRGVGMVPGIWRHHFWSWRTNTTRVTNTLTLCHKVSPPVWETIYQSPCSTLYSVGCLKIVDNDNKEDDKEEEKTGHQLNIDLTFLNSSFFVRLPLCKVCHPVDMQEPLQQQMGLLRKFANYWVVAGSWLLLSASSKFYHSSVCLDSTLTFQFVRGYHRSTVKTGPDIAMYPPKPYASIQPVQKCLQDNIIWKSMLGKGEFAALGRQRVGYWLLSKSGRLQIHLYTVHCPRCPCLMQKFYF